MTQDRLRRATLLEDLEKKLFLQGIGFRVDVSKQREGREVRRQWKSVRLQVPAVDTLVGYSFKGLTLAHTRMNGGSESWLLTQQLQFISR